MPPVGAPSRPAAGEWPLRLVNAMGWVVDPELQQAARGDFHEALVARARARVAAAASLAQDLEPGLVVEQQVTAGYQVEVLAAEATAGRDAGDR